MVFFCISTEAVKMLSELVFLGRGPCTDWPGLGLLSPLELGDGVIHPQLHGPKRW